jgi:DNA-binding PucR family transcriptional regulator
VIRRHPPICPPCVGACRTPRDLFEPSGALARLVGYDRSHNSNLVPTLRAWLDHFGDSVAAASSLFVHQNTFRYRLRRVAEVGEIDLSDPEQRFVAMLQLRVLAPDRDTR